MLAPVEMNLDEVVEELPEGDYKVQIVDAELKTSKAGNPYLRWQMTVVDNAEPKFNGKATWHSTPTTGKGAFRLAQLYKAAVKSKIDTAAKVLDPKDILGKTVAITLVNSLDQEGNPSGFTEVKTVRAI